MTGPVAELAAAALACLRSECPVAHAAVQAATGVRRVRVELDRDLFDVVEGRITPPAEHAALLIRSDSTTVCELLHGELDIVEALVRERVHVEGWTDDVIAGASAMTAFLAGALRCDSMPALLQRLVAIARGEAT